MSVPPDIYAIAAVAMQKREHSAPMMSNAHSCLWLTLTLILKHSEIRGGVLASDVCLSMDRLM